MSLKCAQLALAVQSSLLLNLQIQWEKGAFSFWSRW